MKNEELRNWIKSNMFSIYLIFVVVWPVLYWIVPGFTLYHVFLIGLAIGITAYLYWVEYIEKHSKY